MLIIAAKAAGVQALDTVFSDFNDEEGFATIHGPSSRWV